MVKLRFSIKKLERKHLLLVPTVAIVGFTVWFAYDSYQKAQESYDSAESSLDEGLDPKKIAQEGNGEKNTQAAPGNNVKSTKPSPESSKVIEYKNSRFPFEISYYSNYELSEFEVDGKLYLKIFNPKNGATIYFKKSDGYIQPISGVGANSVSCKYLAETKTWELLANIPSYQADCPSKVRNIGSESFFSNIYSSFSESKDYYLYSQITVEPDLIFEFSATYNIPNAESPSKEGIVSANYSSADSLLSEFLQINPGLF